jgi:hypothetical protein
MGGSHASILLDVEKPATCMRGIMCAGVLAGIVDKTAFSILRAAQIDFGGAFALARVDALTQGLCQCMCKYHRHGTHIHGGRRTVARNGLCHRVIASY